MPSSPSRRRFFAVRGSIAKRQAAEAARVYAVPPAGRFGMRISNADGATVTYALDGTMQLSNARLFLADGSEIDGATVEVHDDVAADVLNQLQSTDFDVEGEAVVTDDGYCLLNHDEVDLRMAA